MAQDILNMIYTQDMILYTWLKNFPQYQERTIHANHINPHYMKYDNNYYRNHLSGS